MRLHLKARGDITSTEGKPPRVEILAYTGGRLPVEGFDHPVIVDAKGLEFSQVCPVLIDHEDSVENVLGQTTRIECDQANGVIRAAGVVTGESGRARIVQLMAKQGHAWQASIGAVILQREDVPAGKTVVVNGRSFAGPVVVARRASLREISFVAAGADHDTTARIAAALAAKGRTMAKEAADTTTAEQENNDAPTFEEWVASLGFDPATLSEIQREKLTQKFLEEYPVEDVQAAARIQRASADRRQREGRLDIIAAAHPDIVERAAAEGWNMDRVELEVVRASRPSTHAGMAIGAGDGRGVNREQSTLEACLLVRAGRSKLAEATYGRRVMESTDRLRAKSFPDLCAMALRIDGKTAPANRDQMIRAAFTTVSLPTALSNTMGRAMWDAYREAASTWRSFARILPAANFKPQKGIRPSGMSNLSPVGGAGELKHGVISEEATYDWSVDTFGEILEIDRKTVVNDDLNFLDDLPMLLGRAALRTLSDLVWRTILANGGSFFSTEHGNYVEGAQTVLSATSLSQLVTAMRTQRDAKNNDLDLVPAVLTVPPELETSARALLNSELIQAAEDAPMGNALQNIVKLEVESRLSNDDKFTDASATGFYLFGKPEDAPVVVGFLDGQESPTVETFGMDHDINKLGVGLRIYHDFGCALGDYRAAARSKGAA